MTGDPRIERMLTWLSRELGFSVERWAPASADASFRRYFRVWRAGGDTRVVMDAPPDKEDTRPFTRIAALLQQCDVHVPRIDAADADNGFLLLEDLGSTQYLARLKAGDAPQPLYADALQALRRIQISGAHQQLPPYDREALQREMALMPEWFCQRHLRLTLTAEDHQLLQQSFDFLATEARAQPVVFVHRDYHSRNLMLLPQRNPGIVDFQDALAGPVGYDLASVLKDCYIRWPRHQIEGWLRDYRAQLPPACALAGSSEREFIRWFDLIGLQRHLKVLGIFARLWYRDGKSGYLHDLPLTLDYVRDALERFAELQGLSAWLARRVLPAFEEANARALTDAARA